MPGNVRGVWQVPVVLMLSLGLLTTGCTQLGRFGIGTTAIAAVNRDPAQYKTVMVRGKVTNQFSLFGAGLYEVDDGSGKIWVATQSGVPSLGSRVVVQGEVNMGINISGQNFGVTIAEQSRQTF
ncbi:MAG: hypothetical protein Q6J68_07305 [Thermostichales cyanobacterium SZTDM-1c_bins_54]